LYRHTEGNGTSIMLLYSTLCFITGLKRKRVIQ